MTVYRIENIAKDVRIALDRNGSSAALADIGDVDTLTIDEIIISKIIEGIKHVHSTAPAYLIDGAISFAGSDNWEDKETGSVHWEDKESGWILLPNDFMRFVSFKMDDWSRPVYNCSTTDDIEYEKQSSRFKGLRGTSQKPLCFIAIRPEGRALEFYSSKSTDAEVEMATYLPYPMVESDSVKICSKCYDAVIYTIAALVLMTFGDAEKSNVFNELAKSSLI